MDRREDLVSHRSATMNRLLWRIHELDPAHAPKTGSLDRPKTERELGAWLVNQPGLVADLARDELSDIMVLTGEDRGGHTLKGVPGEWHLFAVAST